VRHSAKYVLLALLLTFLLWRGVVPAMQSLDTDFPNYFISSRLVLEGRFDRVYDDPWFQEQVYSFGIQELGKFSPYPPATAFIMLPIASLQPLTALRVWTIINIGVLVGLILMLSTFLKKDLVWSTLIILLSGHALVNNFRFGQFYLILTLLSLWSLTLWHTERKALSGVMMGIGASLKYFPIVFLPLCMIRKEWKIIGSFLATTVVLILLSIVVIGIEPYRQFVASALVPHLSGNIQNRFSMNFQSWNSLLARIMLFDSHLNPQPMFPSEFGYTLSLMAIYASVVAFLAQGLRSAAALEGDRPLKVQFALLCMAGILLFPASATYHYLLLCLPVSILLSFRAGSWNIEQKAMLAIYICIGFIPYSLLRRYDGRGLLTFVAYPRLFLTSLLFAFALLDVRRSKPNQSFLDHKVHTA
jgi:hypothetical protein